MLKGAVASGPQEGFLGIPSGAVLSDEHTQPSVITLLRNPAPSLILPRLYNRQLLNFHHIDGQTVPLGDPERFNSIFSLLQ